MKKVLSLIILFGILCSFSFSFGEEVKEKQLSLKDAIFYALKNNLDLAIQKTSTDLTREDLKIFNAVFIPNFDASFMTQKAKTPSTSGYDGVPTVSTKYKIFDSNITELTPFGGTVKVGLRNRRYDTNVKSEIVNPSFLSTLSASLSQPLLKSFGLTATKYNIYIGNNNQNISKSQLEQNVALLVYNVESAYWDLVYAYQNLDTTRMALERAKDLLRQNEIKMKVGTIGAIEVLSSKAGVARNESNLIIAERTVQASEEILKRILNMSRETFSIIPTDKPEIKSITADFNTFLAEALQNRPEIKQAKLSLDSTSIGVRYSRNQALPNVTFTASLNSYGLAGTTWDVDLLDPTFPRTLVSKTTFKDSLKNSLKLINTDYTFQLGLAMPIGFSKEKATLAQAKINREKAELTLQNTENGIFSEVKDVIKELESNRKLVDADRIAMELEEQNLKAEEKKLSVGLSTNFQVLTYQQQYAQAQSQALGSTINYIKTLAKINRILNRTFKEYDIKFGDILKD